MVDISHKECINCNLKAPTCNYPNGKKGLYCGDCKKCDMVNIITNKCIICNLKQSSFKYPNEKKKIILR